MTPEEIQALIDAKEGEIDVLEIDLKEAEALVYITAAFAQVEAIKTAFEAEEITAAQAEHNLQTWRKA